MLPVTNLKQVQTEGNRTINLIVYGDSGVGKTTLAATAAELGNVLYIDCESGASFINEKYSDKIDILKIKDVKILDEVLKPVNIEKYQTVVIDSITELMKLLLDKVKGTKDKPTIGDWGTVIGNMETYFRQFRDLDKHVILVALTAEKDDEGIVLKRPSLSGKNLPADVVGIVDVCLFLENTQKGRVAHTQASQKFYAKDRTGKLPEVIEQKDLNIKFIADCILKAPEPLPVNLINEVIDKFNLLNMDEGAQSRVLEYFKIKTIETATKTQIDNLIIGLNKKVELELTKQEELSKEEIKGLENI